MSSSATSMGVIGGSFRLSGRFLAPSLSPEDECRLGNLFDTVDGSMLQEPTWQFAGEHASPLN